MSPRLAIVPPDDPEDDDGLDSLSDGVRQEQEARRELDRPLRDYLVPPIAAMAELVGAWAPGELHIVTAFSGGGKTLLSTNLEHQLLMAGRRVYHIGLETRPAAVRLHFACLRHGFYVGDVLSGAAKTRADWPDVKRILTQEVRAGYRDGYELIVNGETWLDEYRLTKALREAQFYGADLVVIDHMDHLATADGVSPYNASLRVTRRLVECTQDLGLRVLALSQLNNETVRGDVLLRHHPPQPHMVYMGSHKRQVCTTMLGAFRPVDPAASPDDIKLVRAGKLEPRHVLQPNTMSLALMKHRHYGNWEGRIATLGVVRGRLVDVVQSGEHPPST